MVAGDVMQDQKGFTLIELMIVVAIISILFAIALPAYQDYTVRLRTTEDLIAISAAKLGIVENAANGAPLTTGIQTVALATRNIAQNGIQSTANGILNITLTLAAGGGTLTPTPALVPRVPPASVVQWTCTCDNPNKARLPAECRG